MANSSALRELNTSCVVNTHGEDSYLQLDDVAHPNNTPVASMAGNPAGPVGPNTVCVINTAGGSYLQQDDLMPEEPIASATDPSSTAVKLNTSCVTNTHGRDSYLHLDDLTHNS